MGTDLIRRFIARNWRARPTDAALRVMYEPGGRGKSAARQAGRVVPLSEFAAEEALVEYVEDRAAELAGHGGSAWFDVVVDDGRRVHDTLPLKLADETDETSAPTAKTLEGASVQAIAVTTKYWDGVGREHRQLMRDCRDLTTECGQLRATNGALQARIDAYEEGLIAAQQSDAWSALRPLFAAAAIKVGGPMMAALIPGGAPKTAALTDTKAAEPSPRAPDDAPLATPTAEDAAALTSDDVEVAGHMLRAALAHRPELLPVAVDQLCKGVVALAAQHPAQIRGAAPQLLPALAGPLGVPEALVPTLLAGLAGSESS